MLISDFRMAYQIFDMVLEGEELPECLEPYRGELLYLIKRLSHKLVCENGVIPEIDNGYSDLRESLSKIYELKIRDHFLEIIKSLELSENSKVLDVGYGDGRQLKDLTENFPRRLKLYGIDNKVEKKIEGAEIVKGYYPSDLKEDNFSLIIFSEFLHLFGSKERIEILKKTKKLLIEDGYILVIENKFDPGLNYRLIQSGGSLFYPEDLLKDYTLVSYISLDEHWILIIKPKGEKNEI